MTTPRITTLDRGNNGSYSKYISRTENTQNERQKEYVRAVKEVKLDHLFRKPFVCSLEGHDEGTTKLSKSAAEPNVFSSVGYDGSIHVWNINTREKIDTIESKEIDSLNKHTASSSFFDGSLLHSAGNRIIMRNRKYSAAIRNGEEPEAPKETEFTSASSVLDLSDGRGTTFFAATVDGVEMFDTERIRSTSVFRSDRQTRKIVWHPSLNWLVYGLEGTKITGYDTRTAGQTITINANTDFNSLSVDPARKNVFITGLNNGELRTYDTAYIRRAQGAFQTPCAKILRGHASPVLDAQYSPNGKNIVTGSLDRTIRVFKNDIHHTQEHIYYTKRMMCVNAVLCTNDNGYVLSGSTDSALRVWKLDPNRSSKLAVRSEQESRAVGNLLKEKYRDVSELAAIKRHKIIPGALRLKMKDRYEHQQAIARREENRKNNS